MIPGMPDPYSMGMQAVSGLASGGPSSASSDQSVGGTTQNMGGIGNRIDNSGSVLAIGVVAAVLVVAVLWK